MEDSTMKEKDVVRLLQQYQHDVKNELQVIHGYLSMGMVDRVQGQIDQWINQFHQEQKLLLLNAPLFILWVIQFNHTYDQLHLTYDIQTNKNLQVIDENLVHTCKRIIQSFHSEYSSSEDVLEINLKLSERSNHEIEVKMTLGLIKGKDIAVFKRELKQITNMTVKRSDRGLQCQFSYLV